jgi:hypothetical protein
MQLFLSTVGRINGVMSLHLWRSSESTCVCRAVKRSGVKEPRLNQEVFDVREGASWSIESRLKLSPLRFAQQEGATICQHFLGTGQRAFPDKVPHRSTGSRRRGFQSPRI